MEWQHSCAESTRRPTSQATTLFIMVGCSSKRSNKIVTCKYLMSGAYHFFPYGLKSEKSNEFAQTLLNYFSLGRLSRFFVEGFSSHICFVHFSIVSQPPKVLRPNFA